jgi:hypothetical protein
MRQWHYYLGGNSCGPVPEEQLVRFLASGNLPPDSLVWTEGMEEWLPAGQIPELQAEAEALPPIPGSPAAHPHKSYHHTAATIGVLAAPLAFLATFALWAAGPRLDPQVQSTVGLAGGSFSLLFMVAGAIAGIIALSGIPQYGKQGLLAKGLCGILLPLALVGFCVPLILRAQSVAEEAASSKQALDSLVQEINSQAPQDIDEQTRLEGAELLPGRALACNFTLHPPENSPVTAEALEKLRPQLLENYRHHPDFAVYRQFKLSLHYRYKDTQGRLIHEIVLTPAELENPEP